jgi:hypothetical protein
MSVPYAFAGPAVGVLDYAYVGPVLNDAGEPGIDFPLSTNGGGPTYVTHGGTIINLELGQETHYRITFLVADEAGDAVDLEGRVVKIVAHDYDGVVKFSHVLPVSKPAFGQVKNRAIWSISADDTEEPWAGRYVVRVEGLPHIAAGFLTIKPSPAV